MYSNCPVNLVGKTVHVDIQVIDASLDYILFGLSYTYAMLVVASTVFCKICFPREGNIVTIDQLTYHKLASVTSPASIISPVLDK